MACSGQGHFARCCPKTRMKPINEIKSGDSSTSSEDAILIKTITKGSFSLASDDNDEIDEESANEEAKVATSNRIEEGNTVEEVKIDDSIAESELFIGTIASPVQVNIISDSWKVILETNKTDIEYKIEQMLMLYHTKITNL